MGKKSEAALNDISRLETVGLDINYGNFLRPSYIVAMAAFIKHKKLPSNSFRVTDNAIFGYLDTIGFFEELWNIDRCNIRVCNGKNYSPLVLVDDEEAINSANTEITNCISYLTNNSVDDGINLLKEVIGELHDNVWSHGVTTGFSMAQKYGKNLENSTIEFAIADCGGGFLSEMKRVGLNANTHQEAIEWCIEKGNSSKKYAAEKDDGWTQNLPSDVINNPMKKFAKHQKGNNHAGLGLAKLMELVQQYKGELRVISGDAILSIYAGDNRMHYSSCSFWPGVIVECELKIANHKYTNIALDDELDCILQDLKD